MAGVALLVGCTVGAARGAVIAGTGAGFDAVFGTTAFGAFEVGAGLVACAKA